MNTKGISLLIGIGQWVNPSAYCNKKAIGFHLGWLSVSIVFVDIECTIGNMGNKICKLKKENKSSHVYLYKISERLGLVESELIELKTKKAKKK